MKKAPEQLICDPLYQLNLVIWMLQPSSHGPVRAVLREAGFNLVAIDRLLPLPVEIERKLRQCAIRFSNPVKPDLVISSGGLYAVFECKAKMFGSTPQPNGGDSQVKQAASLLLLVPEVMADGLHLQPQSINETHVIYLSCHDGKIDQTQGLAELDSKLREEGFQTTRYGLLGLTVRENCIVMLGEYKSGGLPTGLQRILGEKGVPLCEGQDGEVDVRPLYFIPWLPDVGDEYAQKALGNRVLLSVAARVGPCVAPCEIELDADVLLVEVTQGYYDRIGRESQRGLRKSTIELVQSVAKKGLQEENVSRIGQPDPRHGLILNIKSDRDRRNLLGELRKWQMVEWVKPYEPLLFD